jgi:hypothetical protein
VGGAARGQFAVHHRVGAEEQHERGRDLGDVLDRVLADAGDIHTVKALAVEPTLKSQWEERLAAYVKTSFVAGLVASWLRRRIGAVTWPMIMLKAIRLPTVNSPFITA